jgi:hypothetical protein
MSRVYDAMKRLSQSQPGHFPKPAPLAPGDVPAAAVPEVLEDGDSDRPPSAPIAGPWLPPEDPPPERGSSDTPSPPARSDEAADTRVSGFHPTTRLISFDQLIAEIAADEDRRS